jgi:hypothetical protein
VFGILLQYGEMSAKGSFSFRNEQILQTYIDDGVYLRLERIGLAVARVYFVNEGHAEVPVPEGFRITDHSNSDVDVPRVPNREEYFWDGLTITLCSGVML